MFLSRKEWIECISYGLVGLFSLSMFVFGAMFPEYTFVRECYDIVNVDGSDVAKTSKENKEMENEIQRLQELLKGRDFCFSEEKDVDKEMKITCLGYEYLKEIINGRD